MWSNFFNEILKKSNANQRGAYIKKNDPTKFSLVYYCRFQFKIQLLTIDEGNDLIESDH